LLSLKK